MTPAMGEPAALTAAALSDHLALDGAGPVYTRAIDGTWTFFGRIFGGYGAALLVAAALERSPLPALLAASVTFLEPLEPGDVEIEVEEMRTGRSAWAGRAVLRQGGRPMIFGETWCGSDGTLPIVPAAAEPPAGAPPIEWFRDAYPFMEAFEERGLNYPADPAADPDPQPRVALAVRPADWLALASDSDRQLYSLMLADANALDAALRPHGMDTTLGVTHNMTVHWTGIPGDGWLEFALEAAGSPPFAAIRGELLGAGGVPVAWILQQGRVRPLEPGLGAL